MPHPYQIADAAELFTPALVFFPALIRANIARVIELAGGPERLRPHVKTHKTREIARLQLESGVTKHKAATIAEAEMLADVGAPDVLLSYPLVGPNMRRLATLVTRFPGTAFSATIENKEAADDLARAAATAGRNIGFLVDLDVGQHRTGVAAGEAAAALYEYASRLPGLTAGGLHAYDGHNHQEGRADRETAARAGLAPVLELRAKLERRGLSVPRVIAGGTPTFPVYAAIRDVPGLECSPGTYVLHDHGYGSRYTDLTGVTPAAVLLTRVISRPTANRVTFDLGNKSVAADPLMVKRVHLLDVPEYTIVGHNEEHLIIETPHADRYRPGDLAYALPGHVCPTCALHREALTVENGRVTGRWAIAARDRVLTV
ncbi:D-TA family PLP-dependent enzyme [Fimbriiglobus ruber]|uniref:Type III PLP / low-specificity D-threonine aldolase n=1 Tax=Fimbriiglobus ruber TaxID=1908690 RepID=A0A225DTH3_9BACT|nr:D-TA family PLP-dependent enzyme [Fimbriiglobus ruber]OWK41838.1 Type III PLP / low-specificity D-threonine aldolase [Fimbriiglobus ruber]